MKRLGIQIISDYSPEARGRCERMFGTHQERLPKELSLAGIKDMEGANRYIDKEVYLPDFNEEFMQPAKEEGAAFIPYIGGDLDEILCEQHERVACNDNCISFEGLKLQITADRHRLHYVKATVRIHRYQEASLAIFHGPRRLATYSQKGELIACAESEARAGLGLKPTRSGCCCTLSPSSCVAPVAKSCRDRVGCSNCSKSLSGWWKASDVSCLPCLGSIPISACLPPRCKISG